MPTKSDYIHYHFVPKKGPLHVSNYPVITNVQATSTGLITWTTDIPSTSQVNFGTSPNLGVLSTFDGTLVTSHSVQLVGITSGILYYFKVQSFYLDSLSISDLYSFQANFASFLQAEDGTYILLEDGTKTQLES